MLFLSKKKRENKP